MYLTFNETEIPKYFANKNECMNYIMDEYRKDVRKRNKPKFFALQKLNTNLEIIMKYYKER